MRQAPPAPKDAAAKLDTPHSLQVPVPDTEVQRLEGLEEGLRSVQAVLAASAGTLERAKDAFCERLLRSQDAHQHSNAAMREDFMAQAPFSAEVRSECCSAPYWLLCMGESYPTACAECAENHAPSSPGFCAEHTRSCSCREGVCG